MPSFGGVNTSGKYGRESPWLCLSTVIGDPTGWPSWVMAISIDEVGGSGTSTPSLSARPNVSRCGLPGTRASKSVNAASVHVVGPPVVVVVVEPPLDAVLAPLLPPPHAANARAPTPAARK